MAMARGAQERLAALVERVFADGAVEPHERAELQALYSSGALTAPEVTDVLEAFVVRAYGEAAAAGVVTDAERDALATVVRELRLPLACVPSALRRALNGARPFDARREARGGNAS